jgi:hypothetical protein
LIKIAERNFVLHTYLKNDFELENYHNKIGAIDLLCGTCPNIRSKAKVKFGSLRRKRIKIHEAKQEVYCI